MPNHPLAGRVCLVTGATAGIGKATALGLAALGATVAMVGRDRARGEAARDEIRAATGNPAVAVHYADLSSQAQVRALAAEVLATYEQLHVLVNNAGAIFTERALTEDGLERTFATNHVAYFLLTRLLLDRLVASAPARIVNVSSEAQSTRPLDFDDLQNERYDLWTAYGRSKLANVMFTYELARRLAGTNVTVNCLHPGLVASRFGSNTSAWFRWATKLLYMTPIAISPEDGAKTSIFLASAPEVAHVTGKYYVKCRPATSAAPSYDLIACQRLWQATEALVAPVPPLPAS